MTTLSRYKRKLFSWTSRSEMKLILHLGTEKSGTTALQTWLQHNATQLKKQGVWVCQSLETSNHFGIVILGAGLDAWPDLLRPAQIHDDASLAAYSAEKLKALDMEITQAKEAGCHSFIITSEHLHSRIRRIDQAQKIADILERSTQNLNHWDSFDR